jgi:hypothetical protein
MNEIKLVINASTKKLLLDHATIASLELVINKKGDSNREVDRKVNLLVFLPTI